MKPVLTFDQAVSALPRLPSASSVRKAAEMMRRDEDDTPVPEPNRCPHSFELDEHCPVCDGPGACRCHGPAGLWPCALEFGHGGDHARAEPFPVEPRPGPSKAGK